MRLHQDAIVRNRRIRRDHLQRGHGEEALTDREVIRVARRPVLRAILPLPQRTGNQPGRFTHQIDAGRLAEPKGFGILLQPIDPQPVEVRLTFHVITAADFVEEHIHRMRQRIDHVLIAEAGPEPAVEFLRQRGVVGEIFVGQDQHTGIVDESCAA